MKKILTIVVLIFMMFLPNVRALEVDINSKNMVLYNLTEDVLMAEKNKDERVNIASMTKIMTTLVAIEHIDNLDEKVVLNYQVFEGLVEANASVAGFKLGQTVTYRDLLYGTLLPSGADATKALALNLAGSESKFVSWMNKKAKDLGLKDTHFVNTSGLDVDGHYSTVNEVATMLKEAIKNETFNEIFKSKSYITSDNSLTMYSTFRGYVNRYGLSADYVVGAKTGYTKKAGKCLASVAYDGKNKIYYLMVSANADEKSNYAHVSDAIKTYSYYFDNYEYQTIVNAGEEVVTLDTRSAKEKTVSLTAPKTVKKYLKKDFDKDLIKTKYEGVNFVTPFTKTNVKLGVFSVYFGEQLLEQMPLVLNQKLTFSLFSFIKDNILFIILAIAIIISIIKINKIKHNKRQTNKNVCHRKNI